MKTEPSSDPSSERIPSVRYPDAVSGRRSKGRLLREALPNPSQAPVVNVRAAKDRLSSLLEQVSRGNEVVITSDGRPKARLVPVRNEARPYKVDWDWLEVQPLAGGPSAEVIVAADRAERCP
ncbi:MAG: type II toxin-antitoxin system prevent-host-death family antitoxin [Verrucomicrobia bacterium]|nr:type II toxin-antitoxin system prevent-host-death family antitoxin [Verrucomicrobiota bacterium]